MAYGFQQVFVFDSLQFFEAINFFIRTKEENMHLLFLQNILSPLKNTLNVNNCIATDSFLFDKNSYKV